MAETARAVPQCTQLLLPSFWIVLYGNTFELSVRTHCSHSVTHTKEHLLPEDSSPLSSQTSKTATRVFLTSGCAKNHLWHLWEFKHLLLCSSEVGLGVWVLKKPLVSDVHPAQRPGSGCELWQGETLCGCQGSWDSKQLTALPFLIVLGQECFCACETVNEEASVIDKTHTTETREVTSPLYYTRQPL